jgi:hypothetical protein
MVILPAWLVSIDFGTGSLPVFFCPTFTRFLAYVEVLTVECAVWGVCIC